MKMPGVYIVRTGRTDIKPGEVFTIHGQKWRAVTYPHGATRTVGGLTVPLGMVYDSNIYTPEVGELTAIKDGGSK